MMHEIGETWRGEDGMLWKVVGWNSLAGTYMLEAEGDARMLVTVNWFDAARRVQLRPFLRWWGPIGATCVVRGP